MISVLRAVVAFLMLMGTGGTGLALDRVRVETGVDRAVAALGVSGAGVIVAIMATGRATIFATKMAPPASPTSFDMSDDSGASDPSNPYGRGTHLYPGPDQSGALSWISAPTS